MVSNIEYESGAFHPGSQFSALTKESQYISYPMREIGLISALSCKLIYKN